VKHYFSGLYKTCDVLATIPTLDEPTLAYSQMYYIGCPCQWIIFFSGIKNGHRYCIHLTFTKPSSPNLYGKTRDGAWVFTLGFGRLILSD